MNKTKMFKKVICFVIALMMLMPSMPSSLVSADVGDDENNPLPFDSTNTIDFPQYPNPGYVKLDKGAEWVEGEDDIAKVTLSLVGKGLPTTTDVVLVIDRSGSMGSSYKIYYDWNEIPLTFTVNKTINYQSRNNGSWYNRTSSNATITMTAYVDDDGVFQGYKTGTMVVTGLDVGGAQRYRLNSSSDSFNTWISLDDIDCANALISIFGSSSSVEAVGGVNVTFPSGSSTLQNTNNSTDSSETKMAAAKNSANEFINTLLATPELQTINRIAVVSYAQSAENNQILTNSVTSLQNAIGSLSANGGTNIQAGIIAAQSALSTSTADNKYIVVLSDGQPTYSYEATVASLATDEDRGFNYPSASSLNYKLTNFNTTLRGTGSNYTLYGYNVNGYTVSNNGVPTISQALIAKKQNIDVYSVAFDVVGNDNAIFTMKYVASSNDHYYLATDDLSGVYSSIAGKIAKAATNAKVTDPMGEDLSVGYNFTVYVDATHPITPSQGVAVTTLDLKSISWDLGTTNTGGDVTETPATLTYYIKLNVEEGVILDKTQLLDTNKDASVVYTNYLGKWCDQSFPLPQLTTGSGTVNVKYYLTNSLGQPINTSGTVVSFVNRVFVVAADTFAVDVNTQITTSDYLKVIAGYTNQSTIAKDDIGNDVSSTINITRNPVNLNFPYCKTYTVVYEPGLQGTFEAQTTGNLTYGMDTPAAPATTGNAGYTFTGWSPVVATTVTGNATYVAQWSQDKYTVVYEPGLQGTFEAQTTGNLTYGMDTPAAPATTGNAGYTFTGWSPVVATTVTGNATYVAQWSQDKYTVVYEPGLQGTFEAQTTGNLTYGMDTPAAPAITGNAGYTFTGWSPVVATTVTGNATYVAQWSQDKYTVVYEPGLQGTFEAQTTGNLTYGMDTPAAPATTGNAGYTFTGWSPVVATTVTGNATYVAQWSQDKYTVVYEPGLQGTFATQTTPDLVYGVDTPAAPAVTGNAGYTFTGWSPVVATTVTGNATYVAQWSQDKYTVVYEPGLQGTFEAQTTGNLTYGMDTPAAPATTGNAGYTFTGWSPVVAAIVTGNATYVAQWSQDKYTVVYEPGLQGTFEAQTTGNLTYGMDTPAAPATTGNAGYTFTGWNPEPTATVTGNATYVAQWSQDKYTVVYEPGLQGTFEAQTTGNLTYGMDTPAAPATTGNAGYTFTGWSPVVATTVTGNATYVAQWSQDKYTVVYEPGLQGTFEAQTTGNLTYGMDTPAAPATTGNAGYTFTGWSPVVATTVTGNATYVAQWSQDKYTVVYEPGLQGTFTTQTTPDLVYGVATPAAPAVTGNSGYTFTGWSPVVAATVTGNATYVAQWSQDKYTVVYEPGLQGTFEAQTTGNLTYGMDTPAAPATTGNAGYTFTGWSPVVATTVTGNATYVAQWSQDKYTVVYEPGLQGTFEAQTTGNLTYGMDTPAAPATTGNAGYTFTGWSPVVATTVTGNATYVAQWSQDKYTVVYEPGLQGTFEAQTTGNLTYGMDTPAAPATTGNAGYTFTGWSPVVATTVTGNATYVAQWSQDKYTVVYEPGLQGTFEAQTTGNLTYGMDTPAAPATTGNAGYTFTGWSPVVAATVTGNATYVAQWSQDKYTVVYEPGLQGTFEAQTTGNLTYGMDTPAAPATTGNAGYTFTGWSPVVAATVTGNATYVAQWSQDKYTVVYEPGLQGTFEAQTTGNLTYGMDTPAAPATTGNAGYTFTGWSPVVATTVTGNATYVAQWSQDKYTVVYEPGLQGTFEAQTTGNLTYGMDTPAAPATTGNAGYTFTGWSPEPTATVTGNATYVAQWSQDKYTVVYEPGLQGTFEAQTTGNLTYGMDTPAAPATTGNAGYTFTGWSPVVATTVTGNATYVAQWSQDKYTVVYEPGLQGTFEAQTTGNLTYGMDTPAAPATTGNAGYTFTGWNPEPTATVTGNATYVAQWSQDKYTVVYEPGLQGTFEAQTTGNLTYGMDTPAAPATTGNAGYTFTGWSPVVATTVTGNATYVAQWSQDKYTVVYEPGLQGTFEAQTTGNLTYGMDTPAAPATTGNAGYTFTGWSPVVATTVTGNATYVAQWSQDKYTVVYEPGLQGTFEAQTTGNLTYGMDTPAAPATTGNAGYTFTGWSPVVATTVTGNATYVAQWSQDKYTVVYEPGLQGTFEAQTTGNLTYGMDTPAAPATTGNAGYTFTGWSPVVATTVTGNATYVAQWTTSVVEINVRKFWIDSYDEQTPEIMPMALSTIVQRPTSIELNLVDKDGKVAQSITVTEDDGWSGTFVLPMYDGYNDLIDYSEYTVKEAELDDYISVVEKWGLEDGFGVYNIEAIKVPVTKVWEGSEGDEVTITLTDANGEPTEHTLVLDDESNWEGSFKLPKYEKVDDNYYRLVYNYGYELVDYSEYSVSEFEVAGYETDIVGNIEEGFTVTNTIKNVAYIINYLESGTNLPVADSVTKSGIYGSNVTENAINVDGYNKVGQTEKTIILGIDENVINFYYSEHEIEESDLYEINWMYETGYNTDAYNKRYTTDGEGSVTETQIANYVQLHYDSGYTYIRREISSNTVETIVIVDVTTGAAITGSAVTGSGIKLVTTTVVDLYYDRNGGGGGGGGTVIITDPEVPLAELEKLDHFAYVIGYVEGDVRPLNNITREEVAMIFYRLLTDESRNSLLSYTNPFADMENHEWSNIAISTLYNAGIIKGYPDGTFKPSEPITRAEFATIAAKFDKLELSSTSKFTDIFGHWAEKYINSSEIKGWIKGYPDSTFKPNQDITRAEAMTLINNVLERAVPEENIHPDAMFWPDNTSDDWYYEAVMEATNSHDYIYEEDGDELWTGMKANKVWP